ncbi:putative lectin family integral membrane protein [Aspergillus alliaceus]|uniref:putative lectin family integral membrane protein n=1 Tax=Petromyces alliaceus TaxID=209559 RepID=UPI0012A4D8B7|nr:concanavalin A-like lectin/glucanase domain-containing protein [Aspergillus alliaceus]KAB8239193.1 concanavalin A-like lectin/glucanase domain-containing protein [Aspergillus alliaceus]
MKFQISLPLFAALTAAQVVIEGSSFGYGQTLSPNRDTIPGWQIGGEGHSPQILSNKLILTPPYPGNTRGYAWAQAPVSHSEWSAEFQFRASGVERGGGNLQLWYAKDGQSKIGSSSIYTVGQWDGFALVVDMHGGRRGSIRGFLNDGTTDYKSHKSVDSLAFGHCDYSYRNLGRASVVRLKHTNSMLEVTVDDQLCFATNKVTLPAGNTFGVTAATPENPDSFEIFKFVLQSAQSGASPPVQQQQQRQPVAAQGQTQQQPRSDQPPTNEQYVDLSARIELVNKATGNIIREIGNQGKQSENRHLDLQQKLATKEQITSLDARLQKMEQILQSIQRDLEGKDYHSRFNQLQDTLRSSHLTLTEHLQGSVLNAITASTPRMGFFIFLIIAFQVFLAVSYVVYKRRRANMPKKFL